jgi:hypothetical protein
MRDNEVFERIIGAKKDVSQNFCGEFGFEAQNSQAMIASELELQRRMFAFMQTGANGSRLFQLEGESAGFLDKAHRLLSDGKVGAVDGTTALAKIDFMNTTQYACAVGWLTSRSRGNPHIIITETSSAYIDPIRIQTADDAELASICDELDEARNSESWPTTFREYEERRIAIDLCEAEVVFIDGPIFTQNLVTQRLGRDLLGRLIASPKIYIGVIKNLSRSWALCRWSASALETGQGYVLCPVGQPIKERSPLAAGQQELLAWLERANEFVRVVYRPAQKAFAFECRKSDLGLACALLQLDASPTLQHEMPLLMETIDSQLRAGFDSELARSAILSRIMVQKDGYKSAIDATDEREFR